MKNFKLTDLDIIRVGWIVSRMKIYHHTGARIIGLWIDPVTGLYQVVYRAKEIIEAMGAKVIGAKDVRKKLNLIKRAPVT